MTAENGKSQSSSASPAERPPTQIARLSLGSVVIWEPGISREEQRRRTVLADQLLSEQEAT